VADALNNDGFRTNVAELLAAPQYADKLKGPAGATGPAGPPGATGTSPTPASVAEALDNDGTFRTKVAKLLADQHGDKLKGPAGATGPAGPPGANGTSPTPASVAEALDNDGAFRTKVAKLLADQHGDKLKGPAGATGPAGPPGANGTSPTPASVAEALDNDGFRTNVVELLGAQHADKLRGAPGASPNAEEVASILINKHGDQLQQLLAPKPRPGSEPRRRRG
jgi:hypothetical protein